MTLLCYRCPLRTSLYASCKTSSLCPSEASWLRSALCTSQGLPVCVSFDDFIPGQQQKYPLFYRILIADSDIDAVIHAMSRMVDGSPFTLSPQPRNSTAACVAYAITNSVARLRWLSIFFSLGHGVQQLKPKPLTSHATSCCSRLIHQPQSPVSLKPRQCLQDSLRPRLLSPLESLRQACIGSWRSLSLLPTRSPRGVLSPNLSDLICRNCSAALDSFGDNT